MVAAQRPTFSPPGVLDGLHCLVHHAVVRCHHQDDDVGGIGASGSHGREGGMTRRVQEGDLLSGGQLNCREELRVGVSVVSAAPLDRGVVVVRLCCACSPRKAPMCCVMPPASVAATWLFLRLSSSVVFPWSTCPMMVTTGGRGTRLPGSAGGLAGVRNPINLVQAWMYCMEEVDGQYGGIAICPPCGRSRYCSRKSEAGPNEVVT